MTNESVSHYRVLDKLGEGGTAVVYRAEDLALGREVALKFLAPECSADYSRILRFQHEARTIASLNHPNICTIYEIGEHEGRHFIAMELLDGAPLSRAGETEPVETLRLIELATEIADGLEAAHAEGIVHRDLKPANIFVTRRDHVKLLDFGLAVLLPRRTAGRETPGIPSMGLTGGTVPYMSPEQLLGTSFDLRTDLFSWGVVIYELASGRRPFNGTTAAEVTDAILHQSPLPLRDISPAVPAELVRIVDKALEKNRKLRYQTASDLRADLQRLKRDLESPGAIIVATATPGTAKQPAERRRRTPMAVAAGSFAVAGAVLFGVLVVEQRQASTGPNDPAASQPATADIVLAPEVAASILPMPGPATASVARPLLKALPVLPSDANIAADIAPPRATSDADLRLAQQQIGLKLYDQALDNLRHVTEHANNPRDAVQAYFLIASIHETRGKVEDAMSTYLETATRHPDDARAPEAVYRMAEAMLKSKRPDRDSEARRILTTVAQKYPSSPWAPRALMARAEVEERRDLDERDEVLGGSVPSTLITYREVVQRYGSSPSGRLAKWKLAQTYLAAKRYELAVGALEALGADEGEHRDDAWFAAGDVYEKRLRDSTRARNAYARVRPSSPRFSEAQKRLRK